MYFKLYAGDSRIPFEARSEKEALAKARRKIANIRTFTENLNYSL